MANVLMLSIVAWLLIETDTKLLVWQTDSDRKRSERTQTHSSEQFRTVLNTFDQ